MRYGSVCSGIEAASVAWDSLGWSAAWFAEIEAFPSAVLAHHFPEVPNVGDMTNLAYLVGAGILEAPDVLVGGTPCQAFSVAGARKSLDDDRGQLSLEFIKLANAIDERRNDPTIIVWENVPGVLSTKDNAFGCFLGALAGEDMPLIPTGARWPNAGCVYGPQRTISWRVLDAQYFGVAQRRRRVFVVASARADFDPAQVLFEFDGVRRDTPPSRDPGQETPRSACEGFASPSRVIGTLCARDIKGVGNQYVGEGKLILPSDTHAGPHLASGKPYVGTLMANAGTKLWLGNQEAFSGAYTVIHATQDPITLEDLALPLGRNNGQENAVYSILGNHIGRAPGENIAPCLTKTDRNAITYAIQGSMIGRSDTAGPQGSGISNNVGFTLTRGDRHAVAHAPTTGGRHKAYTGSVRRLTPVECERLQGFPDNWTRVPYRNKPAEECPDGPRYAACGNSMAVPVMRWIGKRIDASVITA